jgi:hypothetical protein
LSARCRPDRDRLDRAAKLAEAREALVFADKYTTQSLSNGVVVAESRKDQKPKIVGLLKDRSFTSSSLFTDLQGLG